MPWEKLNEETLSPKERANEIQRKLIKTLNLSWDESNTIGIKIQEEIIKKLKEYGINSEYENKVLINLKNF